MAGARGAWLGSAGGERRGAPPACVASMALTWVPDAVSCPSATSRRPCPSVLASRQRSWSTAGTASSSQLVTGIASGWNEAASYDPVKRRLAQACHASRGTSARAAAMCTVRRAHRHRGDPGAEGEQQHDEQRLVHLAAGRAQRHPRQAPGRPALAPAKAHTRPYATPVIRAKSGVAWPSWR
jgi:hypothetical protein